MIGCRTKPIRNRNILLSLLLVAVTTSGCGGGGGGAAVQPGLIDFCINNAIMDIRGGYSLCAPEALPI